jgi:hypothetical protein
MPGMNWEGWELYEDLVKNIKRKELQGPKKDRIVYCAPREIGDSPSPTRTKAAQ